MTRVRFVSLLIALTMSVAETGVFGAAPAGVAHASPSLDGLVGWWKFDEAGGTTAIDSSGNGHDGTIVGGAYTTDGADIPGNVSALRLHGDGYVTIPDSPNLNFSGTDAFSISFWAKAAPDGTGHILIAKTPCTSGGYDYGIKLFFEGTTLYPAAGNEGSSGAVLIWEDGGQRHVGAVKNLELGRLTHFALTYDGAGTARMYFDGILAATDSGAFLGGHNAPGINLVLGNNPCGDGLDAFRGVLDDVRLYSRALTDLEVQSLDDTRGLEVYDVSAPYSGLANFKAVLFSGTTVEPGKVITFTLGGTVVGSAVTDATGVATLSGVNLAGFDGQTTIGASVPGDGQTSAQTASGLLAVVPLSPHITWTIPEFPIGVPIDPSAIMTATTTAAGSFDYSLHPDIILAGQRVCVIFTPSDPTRYTASTTCTEILWDQGAHIPVEAVLPNGGVTIAAGPRVPRAAIDRVRNLAYITGLAGDVQVLDGTTSAVVAAIPLQYGTLSGWAAYITVDEAMNRLYVADASQTILWTIDASTRTVLAATQVQYGDQNQGVVAWRGMDFNPSSRLLYLAMMGNPDRMAVIDPASPQVAVGTVNFTGSVGAELSFAIDSVTQLVYVSHGGSLISAIGGDPNLPSFSQIVTQLSTGVIDDNMSVAVNTRTHAVYAGQDSAGAQSGAPARLFVFDGDPMHPTFSQLTADIPLPESQVLYGTENGFESVDPSAIVADPVTNAIYIKLDLDHGGTQVTELDGSTYAQRSVTVLDHEETLRHALFQGGAMSINPDTGRIYLTGGIGESHLTVVLVDRSQSTRVIQMGGAAVVQTPEVSIAVPSVASGGATTVTQVDATELNLALPGQYSIGGALAYDVTTTAVVGFPAQLCFNVSSIDDPETFDALAVLHGENGALVDRTTSRDFPTRTICATVNSLSPFVIARRSTPRDTMPPLVSCGGPVNAWSAADVTIWCSASDVGSGLANPADASFALMTAVPAGVETANAATTSRTVCDAAGNCVLVGPAVGLRIDKRAPTITMTAPVQTTYALHQAVPAAYACTDGGSGVATCTGSAANGTPFDTSAVGSHTFSVTSTDAVGNTTTSNRAYTVVYNQCLLFDATKSYQAGSTVPIKLQLCDAAGANVSDASVLLVATGVYLVSTSAPGPLADSGNANPDNQFRLAGGSYVFNLSLKGFAHGTYALVYTAGNDPTAHTVQFQVK